MYKKILVALENSKADETMIPQISQLALTLGSHLLLLHVADGWAARHYDDFNLVESEEMKQDRSYLETIASQMTSQGISAGIILAHGNPPTEILRISQEEKCELIAMTSHGHRFIQDLIHGTTISEVRHKSKIPLLLVKAESL